MIPVCKPFLPNKYRYLELVDEIFSSGQITNNGRLVQKLENELKNFLGVRNVICVANATLGLQLSYKALGITGNAITTPFSFAATASSLVWENIAPKFVDINKDTFNIDATNIETAIDSRTSAIVPVHVYGNPCNVEKINAIANEHNLRVVYDAAHAFNVSTKDSSESKNIMTYGDASIVSFHATKIFQTVEGGAIITQNDELAQKCRKMINFGLDAEKNIAVLGTNIKMNEFQAAMGLCNLEVYHEINAKRKKIFERYVDKLTGKYAFQKWSPKHNNNYSYAQYFS